MIVEGSGILRDGKFWISCRGGHGAGECVTSRWEPVGVAGSIVVGMGRGV